MKPNAPHYAVWVLAAAGLHAVILFVRWQFLISGPSYAVAAAPSIELSIVETAPQAEAAATPPEPSPRPLEQPAPIPPPIVPEPPPEPLPVPSHEELPKKSTPPPRPSAPRPRSANPAAASKPNTNQAAASGATATQSGASSGSVGNSKAAYLYNPHPPYPSASRQAKEQGTVLLAVGLNERGEVASVSVRKSSGFPQLDQAAQSGVAGWRFRPARMAGLPVSSQIEVPVRFRLTD